MVSCRVIAGLLFVGLNAACLQTVTRSIGTVNGSSDGTSNGSSNGTSAGATSASSAGSTTSAPVSSSGTSTGSSTGTTGGPHGYVGYDGGPHPEPAIDVDAGCTVLAPFWVPDSGCQVCDANNDVLCKVAGLVCDPNAYFCVQCTTTQPCKSPELCVLDSGQCAPRCTADGGECALGFICTEKLCLPGCNTDQDCPAASPMCGYDGQCFSDCAYNNCPAGDCLIHQSFTSNPSGTCLLPCSTDSACANGDYCSSAAGVCEPGCLTDNSCPSLSAETLPKTAGAVGQGCTDAFCESTGFASCNGVCTNGCSQSCRGSLKCRSDNVCGCASDADCASGLAATTAPSCLDGGPPGSGILGTCGCADSSVCPVGDVCDRRGGNNNIFSALLALNPSGACIPRCDGDAGLSCDRTFPSTPLCDPASGLCVACQSDSDCPGTEACNDGTCVLSCVFDAGFDSCEATGYHGPYSYEYGVDYCDTFTGLCVGCLDDYDCAPYGFCQPGSAVCVQCLSNADCPANAFAYASRSICETDAGVCGNCLQNSDCYALGLSECLASYPDVTCSGRCSGGADGGCPAPLACSSNGFCSCSSDSDCQVFDGGIAPTCVHLDFFPGDGGPNVCGCDATTVCANGAICDPRLGQGGACVPICSSDGGLDCATGVGYPACNSATGYCVECVTNQDCASVSNGGSTRRPACVIDGGESGFPDVGGGHCGCSSADDCNGHQCFDDECDD